MRYLRQCTLSCTGIFILFTLYCSHRFYALHFTSLLISPTPGNGYHLKYIHVSVTMRFKFEYASQIFGLRRLGEREGAAF